MHAFRLIVPLLLTLLFANAAYFAEAGQNAHRMMLYPEWSLLPRTFLRFGQRCCGLVSRSALSVVQKHGFLNHLQRGATRSSMRRKLRFLQYDLHQTGEIPFILRVHA